MRRAQFIELHEQPWFPQSHRRQITDALHLLYTYVIPIIPLVLFFDGVVSCLRTYRPQELREIIKKAVRNRIPVGSRRIFKASWPIANHLFDRLTADTSVDSLIL